jgi:alpha-beta hydrolase superfamily lysophospholipase
MNGLAKLSQPKSMAQINADLPIYVLSGDLDPVGGRGKGVVKLQSALQQAGVKQVDLKLYEGGRHEMLNETNRQQVYQDILRWLKKALENNA